MVTVVYPYIECSLLSLKVHGYMKKFRISAYFKVFWCDGDLESCHSFLFPRPRLVFVRMRLIWFLFSLASHCEIIPTVASEPRSLSLASAVFRGNIKFYHLLFFFRLSKINQRMLKGSEHLSQIPSKTFFVCLYSIHECLFMGKFMLYIWYLSNNRHFIKWDFLNGRGNLKMYFSTFKQEDSTEVSSWMILGIQLNAIIVCDVSVFVNVDILVELWNFPFLATHQ